MNRTLTRPRMWGRVTRLTSTRRSRLRRLLRRFEERWEHLMKETGR